MKFNLKGKSEIVTGGGSGIGRAISIALAGNGAKLHVFELNKDAANGVVKEIKNGGGLAEAHACNVASHEQVVQIVTEIGERKPIDILINNAGIAHIGKAL